jgi:hypothetical protein
MKRIDLQGRTFGRLKVIDYYGCVKGRSIWICRCDCGKATFVRGEDLTKSHTVSCGCWGSTRILAVNEKRKQGVASC